MRNLLIAATALAAVALSPVAHAVPIAAGSVLNIVGAANFTATNVITRPHSLA